jgi:cyclophilin family peptidyl-prolyl cis-trans isomerase
VTLQYYELLGQSVARRQGAVEPPEWPEDPGHVVAAEPELGPEPGLAAEREPEPVPEEEPAPDVARLLEVARQNAGRAHARLLDDARHDVAQQRQRVDDDLVGDARSVLDAAHRESERILRDAVEESERIRQAAFAPAEWLAPRPSALARSTRRRRMFRTIALALVAALVVAGAVVAVVAASSSGGRSAAKDPKAVPTHRVKARVHAGPATDAQAQAAANALAVSAGCPPSTAAVVNTQRYPAAPAMTLVPSTLYSATVATTAGAFTMALNARSSPAAVNNFIFLARQGFFTCVIFNRVIPGFADQTGDPTGTGKGGPGFTIPDNDPPKAADPAQQYPLGSVAMSSSGAPNSGGSNFFIVAGPLGEALPNTYDLFGQVIAGLNVVERINQEGSAIGVPPAVTQRILSVTIHTSSGL